MEKQKFRARWADLDPNFHMRHSVYSDYAADTRMAGLDAIGISKSMLMKLKIGPILFNEFIEYFKEIGPNEEFTVDFVTLGGSKKGHKWKMCNNIYKANGDLAAKITVMGAWFDLAARKVTAPPEEMKSLLDKVPRGEGFIEDL